MDIDSNKTPPVETYEGIGDYTIIVIPNNNDKKYLTPEIYAEIAKDEELPVGSTYLGDRDNFKHIPEAANVSVYIPDMSRDESNYSTLKKTDVFIPTIIMRDLSTEEFASLFKKKEDNK